MTDLTPSGGSDAAPANDAVLTIREAAESVARRRETGAMPDPIATAEKEVAEAKARDEQGRFARSEAEAQKSIHSDPPEMNETADPADEPPLGETDDLETPDPAADEAPSVEPPRSWTKEEKEAFKLLPPEHQERIAQRERTREAEIRRGQDEAAKTRKAAEAERQQLEQARQRYEAAVPELERQLYATQQAEFSDIRSHADVLKMAEEDPFRYAKWDAIQKQRGALHQERQQAEQRQFQERNEAFNRWADEQDKRVNERVPELADPAKRERVQKEALSYLTETIGWEQDRLAKLWRGEESLSLRDADVQAMVRDAARWQAAQKAAKTAAAKPTPPVQRPGVPQSKADVSAQSIKALEARLDRATSVREQVDLAAKLRQARRAAG
jgi:Fe-S cluster biosynthesis and repair protein YggX